MPISPTKVWISGQKSKKNHVFLCFPERKYLFLSLCFPKATRQSTNKETLLTITGHIFPYSKFALSRLPSVHCISSFSPLFTRSISLQYPFIALSSPFRGDKNVSSPTLSGRWVGDEWDMSGRKGLCISFVFPLFFLCFPFVFPWKGGQKEVKRRKKGNESSWKWQRIGCVMVDISMNIHSCWHPTRPFRQG